MHFRLSFTRAENESTEKLFAKYHNIIIHVRRNFHQEKTQVCHLLSMIGENFIMLDFFWACVKGI